MKKITVNLLLSIQFFLLFFGVLVRPEKKKIQDTPMSSVCIPSNGCLRDSERIRGCLRDLCVIFLHFRLFDGNSIKAVEINLYAFMFRIFFVVLYIFIRHQINSVQCSTWFTNKLLSTLSAFFPHYCCGHKQKALIQTLNPM